MCPVNEVKWSEDIVLIALKACPKNSQIQTLAYRSNTGCQIGILEQNYAIYKVFLAHTDNKLQQPYLMLWGLKSGLSTLLGSSAVWWQTQREKHTWAQMQFSLFASSDQ